MQDFTEEERRTLVFLKAYEDARRSKQFGYTAFKKGVDPRGTSLFKQFSTVALWIMQNGMKITWGELHWQGYVEYVFESFGSKVPQPGQLKNPVLLSHYLQNAGELEPTELSDRDLRDLYTRVLGHEVLSDTPLLAALNFEGLVWKRALRSQLS